MVKKALWFCSLTLLTLVFTASYSFGFTVLCTEDPVTGCSATIPTSSPALTLFSDGEASYDPVGAGFDISDAIVLNGSWAANTAYVGMTTPGFWTQLPGTDTWVLPASTPCGNENEPSCEPAGAWYFAGAAWAPGTPTNLVMLEADGSISDLILVDNNGPNGSAEIVFYSDPNIPSTPEPGSLALLGSGVLVLAGSLRRRMQR